jgi:hypothetical protein
MPAAATPPAAEVAASNSRRLLRSTLSVITSHPFIIKIKNRITPSLSLYGFGLGQIFGMHIYCLFLLQIPENRTKLPVLQ